MNSYKLRVDIEQWGTTWVKIFLHFPKEFPTLTSVGCFLEIATNCLKTLSQLFAMLHQWNVIQCLHNNILIALLAFNSPNGLSMYMCMRVQIHVYTCTWFTLNINLCVLRHYQLVIRREKFLHISRGQHLWLWIENLIIEKQVCVMCKKRTFLGETGQLCLDNSHVKAFSGFS